MWKGSPMGLQTTTEQMRSTYQILGDLGIEPSTIGLAENKKTIPLTDFEALFYNTHGIRLRRLGTSKLVYNKRRRWFGYETVDDFCMAKNLMQYTKDATMNCLDDFKTFWQWSKLRVPYNRTTNSYDVIWEDAQVFLDERNFQALQHQTFNYGDKRKKARGTSTKKVNEAWQSLGREPLLTLGRYCAELKRDYFPDKRDKNTGLLVRKKFNKETCLKSKRVPDTKKRRLLDLWHKSLTKRIEYFSTGSTNTSSAAKCAKTLEKVVTWQDELKVGKKKIVKS